MLPESQGGVLSRGTCAWSLVGGPFPRACFGLEIRSCLLVALLLVGLLVITLIIISLRCGTLASCSARAGRRVPGRRRRRGRTHRVRRWTRATAALRLWREARRRGAATRWPGARRRRCPKASCAPPTSRRSPSSSASRTKLPTAVLLGKWSRNCQAYRGLLGSSANVRSSPGLPSGAPFTPPQQGAVVRRQRRFCGRRHDAVAAQRGGRREARGGAKRSEKRVWSRSATWWGLARCSDALRRTPTAPHT
jgi:hypothetical protein